MLNKVELKCIDERVKLAKMCLRLFSEKCNIRSTNYPLSRFNVTAKEATELTMLQHKNMTTPLIDTYIDTLNSRLGNCNEKSIVCYVTLKTSPVVLMNNHRISLVELYGEREDHVFIIIADEKVIEHQVINIRDLGNTAVVLDAWMRDWFVPNTMYCDLKYMDINIPNPNQFFMRRKVMRTPVIGYEFIRDIT
ncbi:hypothetical protein NAK90_005562 [Salmonella enterica]|nr:hypothetical protein [Salmonella enterica]EJG7681958.1 hypothetical protein [Salmonella enterica]HAF4899169.1 hypothetical protein [Salmonella enterica]